MTRARKGRAPVPGASRCYVLTPSEAEDAFTWAADRLRARGWTPIEQDYRLGVADPVWIMVELWALPPK